MNRMGLILLASLATGAVYAQGAGGTTMSTDPAKAAAVEKHAQDLKAHQSKEATTKPVAMHTSNHKAKQSAKHKSPTAKPATAQKS